MPALVAGFMIVLTHAPLGIEVLKRDIIFIDLAIAQIAGLGMIAAETNLHAPPFMASTSSGTNFSYAGGAIFSPDRKNHAQSARSHHWR